MRLIGLVVALGLLSVPFAAAQQAVKVARIGYVSLGSAVDAAKALRQGLRELGYIEG